MLGSINNDLFFISARSTTSGLFKVVSDWGKFVTESSVEFPFSFSASLLDEAEEDLITSLLNSVMISEMPDTLLASTPDVFGTSFVLVTSAALGVAFCATLFSLERTRYPETPTITVTTATLPHKARPLSKRLRKMRRLTCVHSDELYGSS